MGIFSISNSILFFLLSSSLPSEYPVGVQLFLFSCLLFRLFWMVCIPIGKKCHIFIRYPESKARKLVLHTLHYSYNEVPLSRQIEKWNCRCDELSNNEQRKTYLECKRQSIGTFLAQVFAVGIRCLFNSIKWKAFFIRAFNQTLMMDL